MHRYIQLGLAGLTATAVFVACEQSSQNETAQRSIAGPSNTTASDFVATPLGRGNAGSFQFESKAAGFDVELNAKDNTDIAMSSVVVGPGGNSGWHSHPGPVFVVVTSGTITFYRAGGPGNSENSGGATNPAVCSRTVYPTGSAFIEVPHAGHVMLARNEGTTQATVTAAYLAPAGAPLRIDQPAPGGNCPG
jgi:quercetin dioxygenase-like cupin family protein